MITSLHKLVCFVPEYAPHVVRIIKIPYFKIKYENDEKFEKKSKFVPFLDFEINKTILRN